MQARLAVWRQLSTESLHDAEFSGRDDVEAAQGKGRNCNRRGRARELGQCNPPYQLAEMCQLDSWQLPPARAKQAKRIHHHQKRRELVRERRTDGADHARGRAQYRRQVDDTGKQDYVLPSGRDGAPAGLEEKRKCLKRMRQVYNPRRLRSDVGRSGDGDPDRSRRKGRRIVDAVADHDGGVAFGRELADVADLLLRKQFGLDPGNGSLASSGLGGRTAVAGQHDALCDPERRETLGRLAGPFAETIAKEDNTGE